MINTEINDSIGKKRYHHFLHEYYCEGWNTFFLENEEDDKHLLSLKDDPRYEEIKKAMRPLSEEDYIIIKDFFFKKAIKTINFKIYNKILAYIKDKEEYITCKYLNLAKRHIKNLKKIANDTEKIAGKNMIFKYN